MQTISKIITFLLAFVLVGCSVVPQTPGVSTTLPSRTPEARTVVPFKSSKTPIPAVETGTVESTLNSTDVALVATPDTRPLPEDWRDWPIVPSISARAVEIYQKGLALGNDPAHFSKVGDCQSIKEVLMGMFDTGRYQLKAGDERLQETIDQFKGSFDRDGMAVQGGFNAASVLSPMWANPDYCQAGETPVECEYRIYHPSIVIISLEVWWNGRTPERYEQYMRRILDFFISKGVLPILSTKADNVEGNHAINLATAKLAYEYDLPLWNWWLAAQALPNQGLDPTRPDGFHISKEAWVVRPYTALQALDSVWRAARDQKQAAPAVTPEGETPTAVETTAAPAPSVTAGPSATFAAPTPGPTPIGGSGRVIFGLSRRKGETIQLIGVYTLDLQTGRKTQIAGEGYQFQQLSQDGKRLLMNQGKDLYAANIDGTQPVKISDIYDAAAQLGAIWTPDGQAIAYIAEDRGKRFIVYYPLGGTAVNLTGADDHPVELHPSNRNDRVYWSDGTGSLMASMLDGSVTRADSITRPVLPPSGAELAFTETKTPDTSVLALAKLDGSGRREAALPGSNVIDYSWSPDGKRLSVLMLNRSDYSGKWESIDHYLLTLSNLGTKQLPRTRGMNARTLWSPDGQMLLLSATDVLSGGSRVSMSLLNLNTGKSLDLTPALGLSSPDLLLVSNFAWIPR